MRRIGPSEPCFIIAEAGVNHNGEIDLALQLVDAAKAAGAEMVKFQAFRSEKLDSGSATKAQYQRDTSGPGDQLSVPRAPELSQAEFARLIEHCSRVGIAFCASPFDDDSLGMLVEFGVGLLKLGSGEITNRPMIEACARTGIPLILSTGGSSLKEVSRAVGWFQLGFRHGAVRRAPSGFAFSGGGRLALLHCVSAYPADPEDLNLRAIRGMQGQNPLPVGFSDHSRGIEVAPIAVAAGACVIEKHLTLDRGMEGPDHRASLEPEQFAEMIRKIRQVETVLGDGRKAPRPSELEVIRVARKSVLAARDLNSGATIEFADLSIKRPAPVEGGFAPYQIESIIGRRAKRRIAAGQPILGEELEEP